MMSDLGIKCSTNLQKVTSGSLYDSNSAVSEELDFEDYKDQSNLSLLKPTADKVGKDYSCVQQNSAPMESTSIEKTDTTDVISVIDGEVLDDGDFDDHSFTEQDLGGKQININEKLEAESVSEADGEILDDRDSDENNSVKHDLETIQNSNVRKSNVSDAISDADGELLDNREINDIEEGEIKENSPDSPSNFVCRFFQEGRCKWGTHCRFMHVTDKGLYNMFDVPSNKSSLTVPSNKSSLDLYPLNKCNTGVSFSYFSRDVPSGESAWDKALSQAKEIIEKSKKRKEDKDFEEKKLYLSPEENRIQNENLYNKKHFSHTSNFNSEQEKINIARAQNKRYCKELSVEAYGSKFKKQEYRKPFNKNAVQKTDNFTWRDPWRRSKSPKFRKFSASRSRSLSSSSSSVYSYSVTSYSSSRCSGSSCRSYSRSPVRNGSKELCRKIKRSRSPRRYRNRRSLSKSRMLSRYKSRWSSSSKSSICSKKSGNSSNNRHRTYSFSTPPQKKRKISQTRAPGVQHSPKTCSFYDSDSEIHSPSNSCRAVFSASACYSSDMSISPISSHSISPLRQKKNFESKIERDIRVNDKNLQPNDLIISTNDTSFKNKISSHNESKQTKLLKLNVQLDVNTFSSRKTDESEYMPKKIPEVCTEWIRTVRREVVKPTDQKTSSIKEFSESSVPRKAKPIDLEGAKPLKYKTVTINKRRSNNTANDDMPSNTLRLLNEAFSKSISQSKSSRNVQKTNVVKKPNESEKEIKTSQLSTQSIRTPKKSKREELLRQLKAVEEAIARKKG
ncbi:Zinc finger CCCH domain-containing protein 18, partial [Stegodyphus mimosarum]